MIDYLKGTVAHIEETYIIMDVNDIGYRIFCANPYDFQLHEDAVYTLYIHYHVREDAVLLYGFRTRDEQRLFRKLIEVSGIGPRVASGMMSGARAEAIVAAIQGEDIPFLTTLPGVGRKTAQRILLDLKDKLGNILPSVVADGTASQVYDSDIAQSTDQQWAEAKAGLAALGYTESELSRCWAEIRDKVSESDSTDQMMKYALQALYKG